MIQTHLLIINPHAGVGKAKREYHKITGILKHEGIAFDEVFTQRREHAIELATTYIAKGYRRFLVLGGDGTMNEVLNGMLDQSDVSMEQLSMGMLPLGSGNDWCRSFNIPFDYRKAAAIIKRGNTRKQDILRVEYIKEGRQVHRYLGNMAGMGFDAHVNFRVNRQKDKGRGGMLVYLQHLFGGLMSYKSPLMTIEIDDKEIQTRVYSLNAGINSYNGGGMKQLPHAVADDGLMDVTLIKHTSKWNVIRNVPGLYTGKFIRLPFVETYTAKRMQLESAPETFIEIDGEFCGQSPISFEVTGKKLNVLC